MKFSIIIPTYNCGRFLADAVASALAQETADQEVVVVDDGSTDDTLRILERFGGRIRLLRQEHQGTAAARNLGLREAEGEWVAFLDADDLFLPGHLARAVRGMAEHPQAVMFYGDVEARDERLRFLKLLRSPRRPADFTERILLNNFIYSNSVVARRECLLRCGGFPEDLRHAGEDWELWVRMSRQGRIIHLGHVAGIYRWRPHSKIRSPGLELREDNLRALARLQRDLALDASLVRRARSRIYYESGVRLLAAGQRDLSRSEFRQALAGAPTHARSWAGYLLSFVPVRLVQGLRELRRAAP